MSVRSGDRFVWVGSPERRPVGSSGKAREVRENLGREVLVDWGGGSESWCVLGLEVRSPEEAARLGIEPWAATRR